MNECIITEKFYCPNEILSGKICSACKIPDENRTMPFGEILKQYIKHQVCDVCGSINSEDELLINDGSCFNCNTRLN
jgi:hypothetical protein